MPYRMTDDASILLVRNEQGTPEYHSHGGPEIDWLSQEQRDHYMGLGLVEEVP